MGYALFNKGFAYLNIYIGTPIFIGEICLITGIILLFRSYLIPLKKFTLFILVLIFFIIGTINFIANFPQFGVEALRDYAMIYYSLFFFLCFHLNNVCESNELKKLLKRLSLVVPIYFVFTFLLDKLLPNWQGVIIVPGTNTPFFFNKMGDSGVWLSAIISFVFIFSDEYNIYEKIFISIVSLIIFSQIFAINRGGAISLIFSTTLILVRYINLKFFMYFFFFFTLLLGVIFFVDIKLGQGSSLEDYEHREFSTMQIRNNIKSFFVKSDQSDGDLGGTKEWRLLMWATIINDVTSEPNLFFKGIGLGPSLLKIYDEFEIAEADESKITKHPHNFIINIFARLGIFGFISIMLILLYVIYTIYNFYQIPRKLLFNEKFKIYAILLIFVVAALFNSNFDIYLEGPMGAIPFWCMLGFAYAQKNRLNKQIKSQILMGK